MQVLFQLRHDDFQYHLSGWFLCHLPSGTYLDQDGLRLRDDGCPCKTRTECRGGGLTEAKEHHQGSSVAQSPVGVLCTCNVHDHSALRHPCTVRVDDIRARAAYRRAFSARLVLHLSRYAKGSPRILPSPSLGKTMTVPAPSWGAGGHGPGVSGSSSCVPPSAFFRQPRSSS